MSTETARQSRGGLRRHTKSHLGSGPKANTARMNPARNHGRFCACGCGLTVSPLARFVKGHYKNVPYDTRNCIICGKEFKIPRTSDRSVCRNRQCQNDPRYFEEVGRARAISASRLKDELAELRSSWTVDDYRAARALINGYKRTYYEKHGDRLRGEARKAARIERDRRLRQIEASRKWLAEERERATDAWLLSLSKEDMDLAVSLLEDQRKDERRLQGQYEASLDETFDDGTPKGRTHRGTVYFDREDDEWLYIAARSTRNTYRRIAYRRFNARDEHYARVYAESPQAKNRRKPTSTKVGRS